MVDSIYDKLSKERKQLQEQGLVPECSPFLEWQYKGCKVCKKEYPSHYFYKNGKGGLSLRCKSCDSEKAKKYRAENKEKLNKYSLDDYYKRRDEISQKRKENRRKNPKTQMLYIARHRAKRDGVAFSLNEEDIIIPTHCPILGIPLQVASGRFNKSSPSLDKIIPELGYVKENVQVISAFANTMKNDATTEQLKLFAKWVTEKFGE